MPIDPAQLPLPLLLLVFAAAAVAVWRFGFRLTRLVDDISDRTGIGQAFGGMLLLGGITSLPELATVSTSAATGNAPLAVNNLIGSAAINLILLAVADVLYGKGALTKVAAKPGILMQGTLGMVLMASVAFAIATREIDLFGVTGAWSLLLAAGCVWALRLAARFPKKHSWEVVDPDETPERETERPDRSLSRLYISLAGTALSILVAGFVLSQGGDAIAQKTGLSASLVGFLLVGFATSLPELSSVTAAARMQRYELAVGDIFGTNLFNVALLFVVDLIYRGPPVLSQAGRFETIGALMAVLISGAFVIGLLERRDKAVLRMGYDSLAAIVIFALGVFGLSQAS